MIMGFWNLKVKLDWRNCTDLAIEERIFTFLKRKDAKEAQILLSWITKNFNEELFCTSEIEEI